MQQRLRLAIYGLLLTAYCLLSIPSAVAQPSSDSIRVAVARNDAQVTLQIHGRFTMLALQTGAPIHQGSHLLPIAVRATSTGLIVGERVVPYAGVRIEPVRDAAIRLNGKRLRGVVDILRQRDATLLVINHVDLEDYLQGVLSKEAPDYWPAEALKAIAIAARTYALYQRLTKRADPYDVTGDVMSQDYGGKSGEKIATSRAVKATAGWIVLYRDTLFPTFYHSTCGGMTEHARVMGPFDLPPLHGGVVCRFCTASPFFSWQRRLTRADIGWALHQSPHRSIGSVRDVQVTKRTASGRVEELTIVGTQRTVRLSGYDVRALLGFDRIRSPLFTVVPSGDDFILNGHGWGHGVGMCQWGAAELARRGLSAEEILAVYYPQIELVRMEELHSASRNVTVYEGSATTSGLDRKKR